MQSAIFKSVALYTNVKGGIFLTLICDALICMGNANMVIVGCSAWSNTEIVFVQ